MLLVDVAVVFVVFVIHIVTNGWHNLSRDNKKRQETAVHLSKY